MPKVPHKSGTTSEQDYRRHRASSPSIGRTPFIRFLASSVLSAFVFFTIFFVTGVSAQLASQAAALLVLNALPFAYIWAILRSSHSASKPSFAEVLAVGIAISIAFQLLSNTIWTSFGFGQIQWFYVFALEFLLALFVATRMRKQGLEIQSSGSVLTAVAISMPILIVSRLIDFYHSPTLDQLPFDRIHPDMYLFEAMGNAISRFGPGESGLQLGQSFRYHWFAYAWSSWFSDQLDAGPLIVLARITPMLSAVLLAAIVGVLASFYFRNFWIPSVAALPFLVGTNFDHYSGESISLLSISHTLGAVWLLSILLIATNFWPEKNWRASIPVVVLFSSAAMGSKVSNGIIIVAGVGTLFLARFIMYRRLPKRYFTLLFTTLIPVLIIYFLYESGQPNSGALGTSVNLLNIKNWNDAHGLIVAATVTILARGLRWVGLGYALSNQKTRSWNITWLALGAALISMAAAPILRSEGGTEQWFLESAGIWVVPVVTLTLIHFVREIKLAQPVHFKPIMVSIAIAGIATGLTFHVLLISEIDLSRPYLPVVGASIIACIFAISISLRWLREDHLGRDFFGVLGSVTLVAAFIFPLNTAIKDVRASIFSETSIISYYPWARDFIMESEDPELKSAAMNAATYYPWARDFIMESEDPELKSAAMNAATWLRENANTNDVLVVTFPTQAWLGALSGLRLYDSFPEQVKVWSPVNHGFEGNSSMSEPPPSTPFDCLNKDYWILSVAATPEKAQNPLLNHGLTLQSKCTGKTLDFP